MEISEEDERSMKSLRATRNAIEHYAWSTTEKEAKIIVGNAISFALIFAAEQLGTDLEGDFKQDDTWSQLLEELYEFKRAHAERIAARFRRRGEFALCCDECGEEAVPSGGGACELCGHWQKDDWPEDDVQEDDV